MDKKLLLLGILRTQDMYGYQLNEFIDTTLAACVDLKKPTAYYLLNKMSQDGWVRFEEEQAGNRPPRRIYSLTPAGEVAFQELLRENLGRYHPVQFDDDIGLIFSGALPEGEALDLLQQRREQVQTALADTGAIPTHPGRFQLMIDHQIRHLQAELTWIEGVMADFGRE